MVALVVGLGLQGTVGKTWPIAPDRGVETFRALRVDRVIYARRIAVASHDEIGELVREFDNMAGAIQEREQRLRGGQQLLRWRQG